MKSKIAVCGLIALCGCNPVKVTESELEFGGSTPDGGAVFSAVTNIFEVSGGDLGPDDLETAQEAARVYCQRRGKQPIFGEDDDLTGLPSYWDEGQIWYIQGRCE
ncbi:hypothetical protein [Pseudaestuariivita rosea]|uniref:hypothetical protein n=1 Tax=Pseudaestuariivita rosea TaxID=2763263 RepID=UPI001ABB865F|nr:hypothetical protein [Pseudaestuariivita rosea]